jgi:hypothetical protein
MDLREGCIQVFGPAVVSESFMATVKREMRRQGVGEAAIRKVEVGYPGYCCDERHVVVEVDEGSLRKILCVSRDGNVFVAGQPQPLTPPPIQQGAWQ